MTSDNHRAKWSASPPYGNAVHLEFKRKGDQAFDFFAAWSGHWVMISTCEREVGIGIHRHPLKRQDPPTVMNAVSIRTKNLCRSAA